MKFIFAFGSVMYITNALPYFKTEFLLRKELRMLCNSFADWDAKQDKLEDAYGHYQLELSKMETYHQQIKKWTFAHPDVISKWVYDGYSHKKIENAIDNELGIKEPGNEKFRKHEDL